VDFQAPHVLKHLLLTGGLAIASAFVAPLVTASPAGAQDLLAADEAERHTDEARALFGEGVSLVAEGRFAEAEAKFREALALHDAPSIRANLASVLFEQGEYPEATTLAEAIAADESAPAETRESARLLVEQIRAAAGFVRVGELPEGSGEVAIDAYVLPAPTAETAVTVGAHVATLTSEGTERARTPFAVTTAGEHMTIELESEAAALADVPMEPAAPVEPPITDQWWFWTAIGGSVVLVAGVAIAVGVGVGSGGSVVEPAVQGDFQPGVLRW
jgi:hypothetical protein